MSDRKLTEAEMITYLQMSVWLGNTASLAPEEAQRLLDIINRQRAKLEALQMDNAQLQSDIVNANMNADHALAEIERLKKEIENLESMQEISPEAKHFVDTKADKVISLLNEVIKSQEQIKAEAVKEFAERLKVKVGSVPQYHFNLLQVKEDIDNLVKEMTRGQDQP